MSFSPGREPGRIAGMATQPQPNKRTTRAVKAAPAPAPARTRRPRLPVADRPSEGPLAHFIVVKFVPGEPLVVDARGIDDWTAYTILYKAADAIYEKLPQPELTE